MPNPLNFSNADMTKLALHKVGNKHRSGKNFTSSELFDIKSPVAFELKGFYIRALKKADTLYSFAHSVNLKYNLMNEYVGHIFDNPSDFLASSKLILDHLYLQSNSPNIKEGDLHIAYIKDILIEDEVVDAIGIFKTEIKHNFFKINQNTDSIDVQVEQGISVDKLDKGCLILNTNKEDGFVLLSVDNNNYDSLYWTHHFLGIDFVKNDSYYTAMYLQLAKDFEEEVLSRYNPKRRLDFKEAVSDYMHGHEEFDFEEFSEAVCPDEDLKTDLKNYQISFQLDKIDDFEIIRETVKKNKKRLARKFKTDTGISIDLGDSDGDFIERGVDRNRGMYFYKIYFNEENM